MKGTDAPTRDPASRRVALRGANLNEASLKVSQGSFAVSLERHTDLDALTRGSLGGGDRPRPVHRRLRGEIRLGAQHDADGGGAHFRGGRLSMGRAVVQGRLHAFPGYAIDTTRARQIAGATLGLKVARTGIIRLATIGGLVNGLPVTLADEFVSSRSTVLLQIDIPPSPEAIAGMTPRRDCDMGFGCSFVPDPALPCCTAWTLNSESSPRIVIRGLVSRRRSRQNLFQISSVRDALS